MEYFDNIEMAWYCQYYVHTVQLEDLAASSS